MSNTLILIIEYMQLKIKTCHANFKEEYKKEEGEETSLKTPT